MKQLLPVYIIYLFIESAALLFGFTVLTDTPTSENLLQHFERFGYVTASIGVTLVVYQLVKKQLPWILLAPTLLLAYILTAWFSYELVHNVSSYVPRTIKPAALRASIEILTNKKSILSLYTHSDRQAVELAREFVSKRPLNDAVIYNAYYSAPNSIEMLKRTYRRAEVEYKKVLPQPMRGLFRAKLYEMATLRIQNYVDSYSFSSGANNILPLSDCGSRCSSGLLLYNIMRDPILFSEWELYSLVNALGRSEYSSLELSLRNEVLQQAAWRSLKDTYNVVGTIDRPHLDLFSEYVFRSVYTQAVFSDLTLSSLPPISLSFDRSKAFYDPAFKALLSQLVPHVVSLGDSDASYIVNHQPLRFDQLYKNGDMVSLREQYESFQIDSFSQLMEGKYWDNLYRVEMANPLLRFSVAMPILMLLSVVLLIGNGFKVISYINKSNIRIINKWLLVAALVITIVTPHLLPFSSMRYMAVKISVLADPKLLREALNFVQ